MVNSTENRKSVCVAIWIYSCPFVKQTMVDADEDLYKVYVHIGLIVLHTSYLSFEYVLVIAIKRM